MLVLDNFESNLDEGSRHILDPELAAFYRHLLSNLVGESRLIITSRYLPAEVPVLPGTATELQLGEFSEGAFLKFLLREPAVERRYRAVSCRTICWCGCTGCLARRRAFSARSAPDRKSVV